MAAKEDSLPGSFLKQSVFPDIAPDPNIQKDHFSCLHLVLSA
jgi:hypothetical protein